MLMATATLVASDASPRAMLSAAAVTDIVWVSVKPDDGLEHVHARVVPGRIELTFFHRACGPVDAVSVAWELCLRVLGSSPSLAHWRLAAVPRLPDDLPGPGPACG